MSTRANKQKLSDEEQRLKKNARSRKYRAAKKAAKGVSPPPKKTTICASFPPDLVASYNKAKCLERHGQKEKITDEIKNAVSEINKMYTAKRKDSAPKVKKPTQKKKQNEENSAWLHHKRIEKLVTLGAETMELRKEGEKFRRAGQMANITTEMRKAMRLVNNLDRKQEKNRLEKKITEITSKAPIEVPELPDEVFNVNWRPTPAPRRFKLKFNVPLPF
jgi:hypothetical protein